MDAAMILAGGKGERIDSKIPKQFIKFCGYSIVEHTLNVFKNCAAIDVICVVIDDQYKDLLSGNYVFANSGISRQHSILNGLLALKEHAPKYVIIHDAVRPLVTNDDIENCVKASENYDGATPVLSVTDTIYRSFNGSTIADTLNRDELFAGQTPECYDFEKYLKTYEHLSDSDISNIRGSSEIAVKNGMRIAICEGNPNNFKITTNADLDRFCEIIEKRQEL